MNKKSQMVAILSAIALVICVSLFLVWLGILIHDEVIIPNSEEEAYNELRNAVKETEYTSEMTEPIQSEVAIETDNSSFVVISNDSNEINITSDSNNTSIQTNTDKSYKTEVISINENDLKEINNDIVGWITIPDTPIDYPIMQTDNNNDYYLYHNYKGEETKFGSIVMDFQCNKDSENLILYGHNMMAGNMFAYIKKYEQIYTFQNNPYIYINIFGENRVYQIFSVFRTATEGEGSFYYCRPDFDITDEYKDFVNEILSMSLYETGISVSENDEIICLSTCTAAYGNLRTVVAAKRIK